MSLLLPLAAAGLSAAQFTTLPSSAAGVESFDPSSTCNTSLDPTNCGQPDFFPDWPPATASNDSITSPVAIATETIAFVEVAVDSAGVTVSTTEYATVTESAYPSSYFDDQGIWDYPDDNSTDASDYEYPDYSNDTFTETITYANFSTNAAGATTATGVYTTTLTETWDNLDDVSYYNDTAYYPYYTDDYQGDGTVVTRTVTTTASNPNGGRPVNTVITQVTTVPVDPFMESISAEPTEVVVNTATETQILPGMSLPPVTDTVTPTAAAAAANAQITNGPIGDQISQVKSSGGRNRALRRRNKIVNYH